MADPSLEELIRLCERVIAAEITEDELQTAWPEESPDPQLEELRRTLFSGLEHLPGTLVDGQWTLDSDAWRGTPEYDDIEFYLRRLREARG
jgi:hypothetical protein